ncbi:MAG: type II secretion system F family protein [Patescibacteria group bacterium]
MPNYFYTAKSFDGQTKTGNIVAENSRQAAKLLKEEGLILIKAVLPEEKERNFFKFLVPQARASATEKILMARNMWIMTATGLSMVRIFDILSAQARTKNLRKALIDMKEKINKGKSLAEALGSYPNIFSELFLSMVKVGEESGTLEEVFKTLSLQLEKEHELKSKLQGAMIYPCIILVTMLSVAIIIMTMVLPQLDVFFSSFKTDLPFYTRFVIALGKFSQKQWPFLVAAPIVFALVFWKIAKTKKGKWAIDTVLLRLPFFSLLVKESNCAFLIRSLSSLIASGVPIVRSLEISRDVVGNFYFKKAVNSAVEKVKKGESLAVSLRDYKDIFPFGMIEMVEVGEETGKTSSILKTLAEFYEQEVVDASEKLSSAIEPVLIVVLGVAVGIFAFSIISPMYSVLGSIE